jgi:hypothetical protein
MVIFHSYVNLPEGKISSSQVPHYNYYSYIIVISLYHHDYCYTTIIKYMFPPKFPPLVDSLSKFQDYPPRTKLSCAGDPQRAQRGPVL